ncbi:NTF2 domain-containing protein transpeptidase [Actinomadura sp. PM05-2]|uniref:NTF2 domain-containing protein transpeptidase n=2 Tax=Actinomadura parmotrematis TaxID=2864039 RepID=A0ABS7G6Q8_9ACTN|nr:NTF2 domain-containing protein transpeptidase [Actinomadura parmotrematis]
MNSRRQRRRAVSAAVVGTLVAGLTSGCFAEPSAMPTVRDFLIAWQVGNFEAAAKLTTGADRAAVRDTLGQVGSQLDAASLKLALGVPTTDGRDGPDAIRKQGDEADARFSVKIDLGENGQPWTYTSLLHLKRVGRDWRVVWNPSVVNLSLKQGQRLAVLTEVPKRADILDNAGKSLQNKVLADVVGVYPGQLKSPQKTLEGLARAVRQEQGASLDVERLLGRVRSAPPQNLLPLLTLQRAGNKSLVQRLRQVSGLRVVAQQLPIAPKAAPELVGSLGPATDTTLQQVGAPYQPGDTIGVNGLQLAMQRRLAGTPTVSVVVQNPSGGDTQVLKTWQGVAAQPVNTTLGSVYQARAQAALDGLTAPASIVALKPSTGQVLAVANHGTNGADLALEGRYAPGLTFGLVSAQPSLLAGTTVNTKINCPATAPAGDQTVDAASPGETTLLKLFSNGCSTGLADLGKRTDTAALMKAVADVGIGKSWELPVGAFTGTVPAPADDNAKAAVAAGVGGVRMSPLAMAAIAGAVQSGTWRPPTLLAPPQAAAGPAPVVLNSGVTSAVQQLARRSVKDSATAANVKGAGSVSGIATTVDYKDGATARKVSWFVGFRGDVAFAIAVEGKADTAELAARFLKGAPTVPTTPQRTAPTTPQQPR